MAEMRYQVISTLNGTSQAVGPKYATMAEAEHEQQLATMQAQQKHLQTGAPLPKFTIRAVA
jgi:hypothetical protein